VTDCLALVLGLYKGYIPLATRVDKRLNQHAIRSNWTEKKQETGAKALCRTFKPQSRRPSG
jgi:hypothetical protein